MRFLSIDKALPGTKLAKPIYGAHGLVLVRENFELTEGIICRLKGLGYQGIYIEDEISEDIVLNDIVNDEIRLEAAFRLEEMLRNKGNIDTLKPLISEIVESVIENNDVVINLNRLCGHHQYTFIHSVNVGILSTCIGAKMKFNRRELIELGTSGMLHDVGKKYVPLDILDKKGKLTKEEFDVILKHPEKGYDMLSSYYDLSSTTRVGVLQHHERFDGSGYPRGLKGEEISSFGRILAVADTYDAMTSDRSYRKAFGASEVLEYLLGTGNVGYDYNIVNHFTKCIAVYPIGTCVMLSDGTHGIVMHNYSDCILRPVVRNIQNKQIIDLKNDPSYLDVCINGVM
ncbi:HD-GYP domain-containing protein [Anaerocolumna sp.]|uniref:HD-GYP domain-containing protein n=1 Tax=Anaerocolumna sp. TaxID=2041569 RepID=UPI0028A74B78|nr:HD-GYP domain-containing protein [Anaerocolumna sp.]